MIATRRGLGILLAITLLFAVLVARELRRPRPEPIDRAIVPGLDPDKITDMMWDRSPLPGVRVTRQDGNAWNWGTTSGVARANGRVIRDVLAALRAGRWHRRAEVAAAGKLSSQLSLTIGTTTRVIGIGAPLEGTEQSWIVVGDHALLVDRWLARALDPEPLALRVRRPVEDAKAATVITLGTNAETVRLEGIPRRRLTLGMVLVRADLIAQLERAVEEIEIVRLSRPPADPGPAYIYVNLDPVLQLRATCPDDPTLAWLSSGAGDGCITMASYDAVKAAVVALEGSSDQVIEPRPMPAELDRIERDDKTTIELVRRPMVNGTLADPVALAELLAALAAPAELAVVAGDARVRARMKLVVRGGSEVVLELLGGNLVRREQEPLALRLTPAAYAALTRPAAQLADTSVWNEEPTTITSIQIDGITYARGAVIGEWTRTPPGAFDPARVEAVVGALATLRRSPDVGSFSRAHEVTLHVVGPAGAPVTHTLTVGAPRQGGCVSLTKVATVVLPASVCASVTALAR